MTRKPEEPLKGAGKGGRVGSSATQHLVQHMFKNTMRDEDVSASDGPGDCANIVRSHEKPCLSMRTPKRIRFTLKVSWQVLQCGWRLRQLHSLEGKSTETRLRQFLEHRERGREGKVEAVGLLGM